MRDVAAEFLPRAAAQLRRRGVEIRGDERTLELVPDATAGDRRRITPPNISAPIISVHVVGSLDEAIEHINRYGSQHTDAIVTARSGRGPPVRRRRRQLRR